MNDKWRILAVLVLARLVMGVQFESVGALGPLLKAEGLDYGRLGVLIGAYLAPGFLVALPGGLAVQKFGDRAAILGCLVLMALGGAMELSADWNVRLAARIVAGAGAVVVSVASTKMIADLFAGKRFAAAMAAYILSWPVGIALCLMALPPTAQAFGLTAATGLVVALAVAALAAGAIAMPRRTSAKTTLSASLPDRGAIAAVCTAATIWGLANVAFATVFGFGPVLLVEKGYAAAGAASTVSISLWVSIVAIPLGGMLASRKGATGAAILGCNLLAAAALYAAPRFGHDALTFAALGTLAGLSGAAMLGLPAKVLPTPARAVGMGIFYSVFYAIMLAMPVVQGALAHRAGGAGIAFDASAATLLLVVPLFAAFALMARGVANRTPAPAAQPAE